MANLTIDPTKFHVVDVYEQDTLPASVDINAGQLVRMDVTTGKWVLTLATTAGNAGKRPAYAARTVKAGEALTAIRKGILNVGEALAGLAIDAQVFMSDTAGTSADTAGTVSKVTGTVKGVFGSGTNLDRVLQVDL